MSRPPDRLGKGDLPPAMVTQAPGPRSRELSRDLERFEAPGVNTLAGGDAAVVWEEAVGSNVLDVDGNRYLDLASGFGVAAVGHRHPRVVAALREQADRLLHGMGDVAAHPARIELARRLARLAPVGEAGGEAKVHFAVSGADAVEAAAKTALLATGRPGLIAFEPSYHGLTLGALALSSREHFREPFRRHLHPHVRRLPYGCDPGRVEGALAHPGGGGPVAGVVVEPVIGREGVIFPPDGWLAALAAACRERGALLIADEIFTGFGRTGEWFAVDGEGVRPDLLCCGKALGGGLPLGAVVGRAGVMDAWAAEGEARHTGTFLANPLACAAALAVLDVLEEEDLPARARRLGAGVEGRLASWPGRFPEVTGTRGRGLLWGVETRTAAGAKRTVAALRASGVLALAGGPRGDVLQLVPPLTITEEQLDTAIDRFERALAAPGDRPDGG